MNYAFVRLLLWFLIAVLPVQGFAAAVRSCCGPAPLGAAAQGHPAGMTVGLEPSAMADGRQDAAMSMADAASVAAPAPSQHCADMPQAAQAIEQGTATAAAAAYYPAHAAGHAHAAHSAHDGGSCGVCAACCIAAVSTMPPALQVIPLFFDSVKVAAAPAALLPGHILGGLERPPRHSFA